jgi:ParB family chromosome partitioning protein
MSTKRRQALGRGLDALLGSTAVSAPPATVESEASSDLGEMPFVYLDVEAIRPNPRQPRQDFDSESLEELAASIRESGLVQPLVVRQVGDAHELVAGERRWRASKLAGLGQVPCLVREMAEAESLLISLVENLQREDLNPIDEAEAYARLRNDFGQSQEQVAQRVGKSRVAVANSLRLLNLAAEMREDVRDGTISAGHARALLGVTDEARRRALWEEIKREGLSVRQAEDHSRAPGSERPRQTSAFTGRPRSRRDPVAESLAEELTKRLGCRVAIRRRGEKRGRVEIHFGSLEEFDRILDALGLPTGHRL